MALSPLRSKSQYHTRSLSLPSQSHPLITQFNEHLSKLNESGGITSASLPSISNRLSGLEELYECVDDLLQQPHTQCTHGQWVDEALDGYLSLLDAFSSAKDIFSQTKDQVKQLLSSIRRNRDESNFQSYLAYRKKAIKTIRKLLKDLKSIGNNEMNPKIGQDLETVAILSMLKEAQVVTVSVLESLLSFAAGTKTQSRSLVSKLLEEQSLDGGDDGGQWKQQHTPPGRSNGFAAFASEDNLLVTGFDPFFLAETLRRRRTHSQVPFCPDSGKFQTYFGHLPHLQHHQRHPFSLLIPHSLNGFYKWTVQYGG